MGFLSKLFGKPAKPYVDGGMRLTHSLIQSLRLEGWENMLPVYSPGEIEVIEEELASFQNMADKQMGGKAVFHPELIGQIQKPLIADGLRKYASRDWRFASKKELPADWKLRVSTFLKAWAGGLNPNCLIEMAEMLAMAGYKTEAKEALEVVLFFPTYSEKFYGGSDEGGTLANGIVNQAKEALQTLS